ncbi:hypothetical protein [Streptomyces sp. NRRL S-350]|uniref:hypothetical protein n=1 Tax=Streptomyces sp. NRRL S-350 TaxID=1463902 RepID=UPI0004BF4DCF|nr:hypothetical protein [Streptomyces sp. NRRL S-350]
MVSFWQDRRTADAAFAAACAALGHGPDERHEEAHGTAFWWTASLPAWPHGVIGFWRHGHDWRIIPLDHDGNPVRDGTEPLPWAAELPPDEAARRVAELLGEGPRLA